MWWTMVKEMNGMDYGLQEINDMDYGLKEIRWNMIPEVDNATTEEMRLHDVMMTLICDSHDILHMFISLRH